MLKLQINSTLTRKVNFASHQNSVPLIRELVIKNTGDEDVNNIVLELSANPSFIANKTWHIDRVSAGSEVHVSDRDVKLNGQLLMDLDEAITGELVLTIRQHDNDILEDTSCIELLARNEWGGANTMPELLAAFVMPNDPAVQHTLKGASDILRNSGKNSGIDGYQSQSRTRVWELVSSIWSSVVARRIGYALPPASFETLGQKIRTPSDIKDTGLSTCLDSALLFAATLEQAGLNPIILLTKEHAFAGVWLQPEEFACVTVTDASSIRKRIALRELIVFETTLATNTLALPFATAMAEAERQLGEENEIDFILAVDIRRARMQSIRALPSYGEKLGDEQPAPDETAMGKRLEEAPILPSFDPGLDEAETTPNTPSDRLEQWQRKLLDLSLRNRLLNFKPTAKTAIKVFCPDPGLLEDKLADGEKIKIVPAPRLTNAEHGRDDQLHHQQTGIHLDAKYAQEALNRREVIVALEKTDLETRLINLYRKARSELQEGGANTLFLALGFLVWRRDHDDRKFRAPLIMIPVELKRKSVRSGVQMILHDDEPRFNTTLLEMLRKDFNLSINGLDGDLPQDAHGIDVKGIWDRMRHEVRDVEGFEVVEDVILSTFSFAKYLMWKDLVDRTEHLKENPVVKHLLDTPRDAYETDIEFPRPDSLDRDYAPSDLFTPLPADSSQLAAVVASSINKDFVMIGPPGTGKSQTIANMIAHNLAIGKTVLFVSEKAAALNVVYRRLEQNGLGDFCLELHSNKSKKTDVLHQLGKSWDARSQSSHEEWNKHAQRLKHHRHTLNTYVHRVHKKHANGLTLNYAMGVSVRDQNIPEISLTWPSPDTHDEAALEKMREVANRIDIHADQVVDMANAGFHFMQTGDWSPSWQQDVLTAVGRLKEATRRTQDSIKGFFSAMGSEIPIESFYHVDAISELCTGLRRAYGVNIDFVFETDAPNILKSAKQAISILDKYRDTEQTLSQIYASEPWRLLDICQLQDKWNEAHSTWWPRSMFMKIGILSALRKQGKAKGKVNASQDLAVLADLEKLGGEIDSLSTASSKAAFWRGFETDTDQGENIIGLGNEIRAAIASLISSPDSLIELRRAIRRIVGDGNELLAPDGSIGRVTEALIQAIDTLNNEMAAFSKLAGAEYRAVSEDTTSCFEEIHKTCENITQYQNKLNAWCAWQRVRFEAMDHGLLPIVEAFEAGNLLPGQARDAFETAYCRWWSRSQIDRDEVLKTFVPAEHENTIQEFRDYDDKFAKLTSEYIRAKLCGRVPAQSDVKNNRHSGELGLLKHELQKRQRHIPLRRLISEMPTALPQLTPCLLMSPLSIAQYLPVDQKPFDLVIFDEASQITVWDAIGAIARGSQTIVAGDPKQLPPTNFFNRSDDEDDETVGVEKDLESILDEMLGSSIPAVNLSWHYRSENESLIAFSNQRYYGGSLITFPAPVTEDTSVHHTQIDGTYERAGARINKDEARAIVSTVVTRLKTPGFDKSIGIVTFNSEQQRLIENLLDDERRKDPSLEPYFSDEVIEPVFVKNLETVQGDERDIIMFCITYGPDISGNMTMNFGPLNKQGGERRLNVAITRARSELLVFSSFGPEDIDLSRTQAEGVTDLKHFLEFAIRGSKALGEAVRGSIGEYESPFEVAVARTLTQKGWTVYPQIGVSTFRIDLGVVHPDHPGSYLVGVECDGATYHSSATARDRDKVREGVLRHLGWEIVRVWSTDWWINQRGAFDKLDKAITALLEKDRVARGLKNKLPSNVSSTPVSKGVDPELPFQDINPERRSQPYTEGTYIVADVSEVVPAPEAEMFYDTSYACTIETMIKHVVKIEGPVHVSILIDRVARAHGFKRSGRRIQELIKKFAMKLFKTTNEDVGMFFWPEDVPPKSWAKIRLPQTGQSRAPETICMQELAALAQKHANMQKKITIMARDLGVMRLSEKNKLRLEMAAKCE